MRDQADLLVIAGDLTNYGKPAEMERLLNSLVRLRLPIVAVLGNHDYESGAAVGPDAHDNRRGNKAARWHGIRAR